MPATRQRLVDGPENDHLELSEVASYLRVSSSTLKRLVREGKFPRPIEVSPGVRAWLWRDCVLWMWLAEARPRMRAARKPQPKEKP